MLIYSRMVLNLKHVKHFTSAWSMYSCLLILGILGFILCTNSIAQNTPKKDEIGIDEKIGQYVPLDVPFVNEDGTQVVLKDLVGNKPFLLSLNYYHCPGICDTQMSGIADVLDKINLQPGIDFKMITISFDPTDKPAIALMKKATYFTAMTRKIPDSGWYFLTGTQENIAKIANAIGFRYKKTEGAGGYYLHSGALAAISPEGKIARYIYGLDYLPFDLQMALTEASQGKSVPTMNKMLQYCFSYEPQGRRYVFNIVLAGMIGTMLFALCFLGYVLILTKKKKREVIHHG